MSFANTLKVSASGLSAQRLRMDVISNNLANANSTRTDGGGAYKRQQVVFSPMFQQKLYRYSNPASYEGQFMPLDSREDAGGVKVVSISQDSRAGKMVHDPSHPDANSDGYVEHPNVNVIAEMTDMISANRSYEANVTSIQTIKAMAMKALEIGRA